MGELDIAKVVAIAALFQGNMLKWWENFAIDQFVMWRLRVFDAIDERLEMRWVKGREIVQYRCIAHLRFVVERHGDRDEALHRIL